MGMDLAEKVRKQTKSQHHPSTGRIQECGRRWRSLRFDDSGKFGERGWVAVGPVRGVGIRMRWRAAGN